MITKLTLCCGEGEKSKRLCAKVSSIYAPFYYRMNIKCRSRSHCLIYSQQITKSPEKKYFDTEKGICCAFLVKKGFSFCRLK